MQKLLKEKGEYKLRKNYIKQPKKVCALLFMGRGCGITWRKVLKKVNRIKNTEQKSWIRVNYKIRSLY